MIDLDALAAQIEVLRGVRDAIDRLNDPADRIVSANQLAIGRAILDLQFFVRNEHRRRDRVAGVVR